MLPPGEDFTVNENVDIASGKTSLYRKNALRAIIYSTIGCAIFFLPIKSFGGNVPFGIIINTLSDILGNTWLYFLGMLMVLNVPGFFYGKYMASPDSWLKKYYKNDSIVQGIIYTIGAIFTIMILTGSGWEPVIAEKTGKLVLYNVIRYTAWILPIGGLCVPLLLDYGILEFIGRLLEPFMRPIYNLPGRAALNAIASFVSSSSIAVYITSRVFKERGYTEKEWACVATSFSAVSVGFAALAAQILGMMPQFTKIFFSALSITFLVAIVMVRIPPLSRKKKIYFDGKEQNKQDILLEKSGSSNIFKNAFDRAVGVASANPSILKNLKGGLLDGVSLMPKVIPFLATLGISGLMVAEYTNFFTYLGIPLVPFYNLLHLPDAAVLAKATLTGIAEMLLPVLVAADANLTDAGKFFILNMALVQIVFFSEPATIMLAMGVPCKWYELVIIFFERCLIAAPIIALFMHLLY